VLQQSNAATENAREFGGSTSWTDTGTGKI
jgi:hypothetical protein